MFVLPLPRVSCGSLCAGLGRAQKPKTTGVLSLCCGGRSPAVGGDKCRAPA